MADGTTIAIDVGNTSMQLGQFSATAGFPQAVRTLTLPSSEFNQPQLTRWLPKQATVCYVASVYREADRRLCDWLRENRPALPVTVISSEDFPIVVLVDESKRIGADRLAAAVAANFLRSPNHAAIIVDSGTAITVDAVDRKGQFLGGAIVPGWSMSATALHRAADLLPLIEPVEQRPPAIGKNTEAAIRSGLYWGAVGAVRELVAQLQREAMDHYDVFVTGGGANMLAEHLDEAIVRRDLVLAGVVLAGRRKTQMEID